MKRIAFLFCLIISLVSCEKTEQDVTPLTLEMVTVGGQAISRTAPFSTNQPIDRHISLLFSHALDENSAKQHISLMTGNQVVNLSMTLSASGTTVTLFPVGLLANQTTYRIVISENLKGVNGNPFAGTEVQFTTVIGGLTVTNTEFEQSQKTRTGRVVDVSLEMDLVMEFSDPLDASSIPQALRLTRNGNVPVQYVLENEGKKLRIKSQNKLLYLSKYQVSLSNQLKGKDGQSFGGWNQTFFTKVDATFKFPQISDEELMTKVQEQTFKYFWDFAHPGSGMARERNSSGNLVTMGGSGFGVMAILVGIERGFISRQQGVDRLAKIVDFLERADRFHGAWPHWLDGNTGDVIPFSQFDNGGDLVETALMAQGLLTVRSYLQDTNPQEKAIKEKITQLWEEVEWDWYTRGGQNLLYWHWSPQHQWQMNLPILGWNESLIVYVLAAASPTHPISKAVYDAGWARNGAMTNGKSFYNFTLPLGYDFGGPLFFAHYSFLGLDPRNLTDQYANYWTQTANHTRINREHCIQNPLGFVGYGAQSWGLTASDNHLGYNAHSPTNDLGVISPTAALSSMPFTPTESLEALHHFYYLMGDRLWGEFGFYDAFNVTEEWYADSYLAIDQGPIILMIENYRTGLLWKYFMQDAEVRAGLDKLNFNY
jgi:hypothetical protein